MKNEQEKLLNFKIDILNGVSVTHGYNITNAFPVHFHTTYNLGFIEYGNRFFYYRGSKYDLKQNDIFIIQPFEPHCCKSIDKTAHSYKVLSFPLDKSIFFPQLVINSPQLLNLLKEFHTLAEYEIKSSKLEKIFNEIIIHLNKYSTETNSEISEEIYPEKIYLAKKHIEEHCDIELTLKEMANVACLSEYHFNRCFHKLYGLSPYAYYLVCRMKKVQNVLIKQKSVTTTTYETGFFDQSHFTKLFKKYIGVTPGKYLKDNNNLKFKVIT